MQGLPPYSPLLVEESEGETMEQTSTNDSHVEGVPVTKYRE